MQNPQALIEKILALPPEWIAEVEDFVEFLTTKNRQRAAMDRFLAVAPALEKAGAPITEEEIQAEIDAARAERRAREAALSRLSAVWDNPEDSDYDVL